MPTVSRISEGASLLEDHWWWRRGWRVGRHFYAFHFTVGGLAPLVPLVARYQEALSRFSGLDLIPTQWLHLTLQGVGFVDEVSDRDLHRLAPVVGAALADMTAPVIGLHRPVVAKEAVYLPVEPARLVVDVRNAVRGAIAAVFGEARLEPAPSAFRPHVSIAYANAAQPGEPITRLLDAVEAVPARVTLDSLPLLEFHRDHRMYEWTTLERFAIGTRAPVPGNGSESG